MVAMLRRSSAALIAIMACTILLVAHYLQLRYDYEALSSRYMGLQRSYEALSLDYSRLKEGYETLSSRLSDLRAEYEMLSGRYSLLQESYSKLRDQYSYLERSYEALNNEYSSLKSRYAILEARCDRLASQCARLNETIAYMIRTANSYIVAREAMPRVLNSDAVRATAPAVLSAGVSKLDFWSSLQKIYDYVVSNIKYVHDVEMPLWYVSEVVTIEGRTYIHDVRYYNAWNYVQTPELTLRIGQGDCDDQAVLAYAMIKHYMREVYGAEYALYLACVEFPSGSTHMAVLMPVQGGRVCIIDPAGRYLTSQYGRITSRPALEELQRYSSHWTSEGGIRYVELWNVKLDGSPSLVAKGTIEEVARALS